MFRIPAIGSFFVVCSDLLCLYLLIMLVVLEVVIVTCYICADGGTRLFTV